MLYRPSFTAKKSAVLAAAMLASVHSATSVSAQDIASSATPPLTCTEKYGPTDAGVHCTIRQMDKDIADAKARGAAADKRIDAAQKRGAAADIATKCMEAVGKGIEAAKAKGPLAPDMKMAFRKKIEACDRASSLN